MDIAKTMRDIQASKRPSILVNWTTTPKTPERDSGYWEEDSAAFFWEIHHLFTQILAIMGKPLNLISVMVPLFFGPDAIYLQMDLFHVLCGIIC